MLATAGAIDDDKRKALIELSLAGKHIELVRQDMSDGTKQVTCEWGQRAPGVRVLIRDDEGKILLTREHRYEQDGFDYRLPGGKVADSLEEWHQLEKDGRVDEAAAEKAVAEAREEAGVEVDGVELIEVVPEGATFKWDLHYFEAKAHTIGEQALEEGESITTGWYTPDEVAEMMRNRQISEGRTVYILAPLVI